MVNFKLYSENMKDEMFTVTGIEPMASQTAVKRSIHRATRTRGEQGHFFYRYFSYAIIAPPDSVNFKEILECLPWTNSQTFY